MLSWDQEKERNVKVLANTKATNTRLVKSWLMLNYSEHDVQKNTVRWKGKEKQIDYILTKRRYLRNVKDAEANDMIHMGSDHR